MLGTRSGRWMALLMLVFVTLHLIHNDLPPVLASLQGRARSLVLNEGTKGDTAVDSSSQHMPGETNSETANVPDETPTETHTATANVPKLNGEVFAIKAASVNPEAEMPGPAEEATRTDAENNDVTETVNGEDATTETAPVSNEATSDQVDSGTQSTEEGDTLVAPQSKGSTADSSLVTRDETETFASTEDSDSPASAADSESETGSDSSATAVDPESESETPSPETTTSTDSVTKGDKARKTDATVDSEGHSGETYVAVTSEENDEQPDTTTEVSQSASGEEDTVNDEATTREANERGGMVPSPTTSDSDSTTGSDSGTSNMESPEETSSEEAPSASELEPYDGRDKAEFSCVWKHNDDSPCVNGLTQRLEPLRQGRWIFLGDSTMSQTYKHSKLATYLSITAPILERCPQYSCATLRAGRCDTNEQLKLPRPDNWVPPNFTMAEGPIHFGLANHFCQDCWGCDTLLLSCDNRETNQPCQTATSSGSGSTALGGGLYGGFISVEFARDTEIQSHDYITTQENVVHYIDRDWNTDEMVADFGRPVCVVGTGIHDKAIDNVQLDAYLTNVEWYASLLLTVCDHVVWLANTCPQTDDYAQTKVQTKEWNDAVHNLLQAHDSHRISFVDVYEGSIDYDHSDNMHMMPSFYIALGNMFLQVIGGEILLDAEENDAQPDATQVSQAESENDESTTREARDDTEPSPTTTAGGSTAGGDSGTSNLEPSEGTRSDETSRVSELEPSRSR